jgi:MSHA pilin protein MshA
VAKTQGIYGAIKSASVLAKSRCELDLAQLVAGGNCTPTAGTINMDGAIVDMVNRYPAATLTGIDRAAQVSATEGIVIGGTGAQRIYEIAGANLAAECRIIYNEAPLGSAPDIQILTSGC